MTANALRFLFAESYVAVLNLGDRILFDQDYAVVKPILHLVGGLLYRRRLRLSLSPDLKGWEVVSALSDDEGIQGVRVVERQPIDYAVKPVAVPMDNPFSAFDTGETLDVRCGRCTESWFSCEHRASVTLRRWDETTPMGRGGQA